ncbi:helix-turn-helix domain-containing protein [Staphylococcus coagulans]|uniref:helix-turn-helix domain-containing protein n=1 Tax=Staphylococcus coagulans TaxID=74706 RepID=UPI0015FDB406|nr:helix-turn-helix transcriptional regulator [Staphylococcus coagulans]MBA8764680.1 helix-turn-helix domain-containing protein [Staphylococcus coagulans]MBT2810136.1 helix-turn-helix transcriptional regulator [Staphylococcus coagulans]MBT2821683.1 helix-turn-helix transcriptional regulator [Staphylococcus coagulans]MBT2830782.1 helix-turn-helix transcriptional regulator [Staphylococcus coagulans]MBT2839988.1 helix-turn-helix transcriptional regulator [Staphylococcus coagulans]
MTIGQNIKRIRKERSKTQEEFATLLGISRTYLSDIENDRAVLSNKNLNKIANKMGVSYQYLIVGNKMLGDLTNEELEKQMFNLSKHISQSKSKREAIVKENLFDLLKKDLSYLDVHYFNNIYNFYELEKTEDDNLLFISVLLQMLRQHKMSGSKEAYDDITNEFNDFLKRYLNIK